MKKILILADGAVAKEFVRRVANSYSDTNVYDIVHFDDDILPKIDSINCRFYKFDPTSHKKLEALFSKNHLFVYIVMQEMEDALIAYENIRLISKSVEINMLDFEDSKLDKDDENLIIIKTDELLANRLMSLVPNMPAVAQYVGLGVGEISEVQVPFGSTYAYRHISNIEQKKWRIAAVYRNQELILIEPTLMIRPGDNLLIIGEPAMLKNVYKAIKLESGQFPAPYGRNIFLILDISRDREEEASKELDDMLNLHRRIKNKILFIKVVNPNSFMMLDRLRNIDDFDIIIDIAYRKYEYEKELADELNRLNIGLVVVSIEFFEVGENRRLLFDAKKPVLKLGYKPFGEVEETAVMLSSNPRLEHISSSLFDLSSQLGLSMKMVTNPKKSETEEAILEHYKNLAEIHSKELEIDDNETNAIMRLKKIKNLLLFFPFEKTILKRGALDIFRISEIERLYPFVEEHHQIFIPTY